MEIRCPIHGSIYYSTAEVDILDTPEFQRLRAIKQLGYAEFSFPGATHNRYIHSVGVGHLAGLTFDSIFRVYPFSRPSQKQKFRQVLRLAALLHDVGHGPLSHTTEQVMPHLSELDIKIYKEQEKLGDEAHTVKMHDRKANHEDYTIKFVTDSRIADTIQSNFGDITPIHVACLIDKAIHCPDDFFIDNGVDFRPILSQLVSSELDVDRLDYLERDSYFCGTNYGKIDLGWIVQNLTFFRQENKMYLGLNRRALYAFDDFLISRHHMNLMVYCHHKSIIYEEMLTRYLTSPDCTFVLPGDIKEYTLYNDYRLHEHLRTANNPWAQRVALRNPFRVVLEQHNTEDSEGPEIARAALENEGIEIIRTSSKTRLSKYHTTSPEDKSLQIYVVDQYDPWAKAQPINRTTEIFNRYEGARIIDRIYVAPENTEKAKLIIQNLRSY